MFLLDYTENFRPLIVSTFIFSIRNVKQYGSALTGCCACRSSNFNSVSEKSYNTCNFLQLFYLPKYSD
jgi:hypothetical protein